jgi:hypothetical protein
MPPLKPNYPGPQQIWDGPKLTNRWTEGHPKAGQTKAFEDYTPGEKLAHIRDVCNEARTSVECWRPVDRAALAAAAKLAKSLDNPEHVDMVAAAIQNVDATEVRRGGGGAAAKV